MPTSAEFVALCRAQVALLTQGLGASLSIVYLAQELLDGAEAQLVPVIAYPETAVDWQRYSPRSPLANLTAAQSAPRLLSDSTGALSSLDEPLLEALLNQDSDQAQRHTSTETPTAHRNAIVPQRQFVLPLIHEGVVLGLLVTSRDDRGWSEWEQSQIQQIANTIAMACVLDHRYQWLEQDRRQQRLIQEQQHDMLDNLLHQFRNSLTALQTFGKLILKRLLPGDNNREIAASIVRETARLKELSQQLEATMSETEVNKPPLSLPPSNWQNRSASSTEKPNAPLLPATSFLSGATLPLEPGSVLDVLTPLLASAESIAQERNLILHLVVPDHLPRVEMNSQALREVLNNLIENALKYTPAGGQIWVQVKQVPPLDAEESGWVEIAVTDTGPGIPTQDLPHIFERRYRGVQSQGEIPGSGLGLAIAQTLMKQMHGNIQVFSPAQLNRLDTSTTQPSKGAGTTFVIQLPVSNVL